MTAVAARAVAVHNAAAKWNKALLDNAARPSGALVYDPGADGSALPACGVVFGLVSALIADGPSMPGATIMGRWHR